MLMDVPTPTSAFRSSVPHSRPKEEQSHQRGPPIGGSGAGGALSEGSGGDGIRRSSMRTAVIYTACFHRHGSQKKKCRIFGGGNKKKKGTVYIFVLIQTRAPHDLPACTASHTTRLQLLTWHPSTELGCEGAPPASHPTPHHWVQPQPCTTACTAPTAEQQS